MADNYQQWSEMIEKLTPEEAAWLKEKLTYEHEGDDDPPPWYDLDSESVGFEWSFQPDGLWVYAEDYSNLETLGELIHLFLKTFRPKEIFTLTWANTCSKMRCGQFSGGTMVVSAKSIRFGYVQDILEAAAKLEVGYRSKKLRRARINMILGLGFKDINELKKDVEEYERSK